MLHKAANPPLADTVVNPVNSAPVDADGDWTTDFASWSGTLVSAECVLTRAHALKGTDGQGAGIVPANLTCRTDGLFRRV